MASQNLTRLNVALTASVGPFASAMKGASNVVGRFGDTIKGALLSPLNHLAALVGTGAIIIGLKRAAERIEGLAKASERLGITTEKLAGLEHAADLTHISAEQLTTSMERMIRKIQDAATGSREAQKAISDIGLKVSDLAAMNPDQQFSAIAEAIKNLGTQGQKSAAMFDIFGKKGGALAPMLNMGAEGLAAASKEAEQLGLAVSGIDAAKVEEANQAFHKVGESFSGIFNNIVIKMAPFSTAVANMFLDAAKDAHGFKESIDETGDGAESLATIVVDYIRGLSGFMAVGRAGMLDVGAAFFELADTATRAFEVIGQKIIWLKDLAVSVWNLIAASFNVAIEGLLVPLTQTLQLMGRMFADALDSMAVGAGYFSDATRAKMVAAAQSVRDSLGSMGDANVEDVKKNAAMVGQYASEVADNTKMLFEPVVTEGSAAMRELQKAAEDAAANQHAVADAAQKAYDNGPSTDTIISRLEAEQQARADARAKELTDLQAHLDDEQGMRDGAAQTEWEQWAQQSDDRITRQQKFWNVMLSGQSQFFGNMSKLQNTHSKLAQKIGRVAGKAQIGIDTAQAAMAAYKNGVIAGGPFYGQILGGIWAAAAIAAGAIQMSNLDSASSGGSSAPATSGGGGANSGLTASKSAGNGQTLLLQGDSFSAESLVKLFAEAKERGILIEGVRRG